MSPRKRPPPKKRRPRSRRKRKRKKIVSRKRENAERRKRRRLREEQAPGRGVTKEDRRAVFLRYGKMCLKCGAKKRLVLDHVVSLYAGGLHDPCNLQPLCWKCNTAKGWKGCDDYRKKPFNDSIHQTLVRQIKQMDKRKKDEAQLRRILRSRRKKRTL